MKTAEHVALSMALMIIKADKRGEDYKRAIDSLEKLLAEPPEPSHEERNFRWAYAAVVALAKRKLQDANNTRENENDWPAGQEWDGLVASSQSIFLRQAREEAGIPHEEFLAGIRSGEYDVDDLVE